WQWSIAAALALILVVLASTWKGRTRSTPAITQAPIPVQHVAVQSNAEVAMSTAITIARVRHTASTRHSLGHVAATAAAPKLAQFPSPQPLTEQEQILARYVARFHEQAVLVASLA